MRKITPKSHLKIEILFVFFMHALPNEFQPVTRLAFCAVKVPVTKGFAKNWKFSKTRPRLRSLGEGVSDSPFFSKTESHIIQKMSFYNSLNNSK